MVRCLAVLATLAIACTAFGQQDSLADRDFRDIPSNHWAYAALSSLASNAGIRLTGRFGPGAFSGRPASRKMVARAILEAFDGFVGTLGEMRYDRMVLADRRNNSNRDAALVERAKSRLAIRQEQIGSTQENLRDFNKLFVAFDDELDLAGADVPEMSRFLKAAFARANLELKGADRWRPFADPESNRWILRRTFEMRLPIAHSEGLGFPQHESVLNPYSLAVTVYICEKRIREWLAGSSEHWIDAQNANWRESMATMKWFAAYFREELAEMGVDHVQFARDLKMDDLAIRSRFAYRPYKPFPGIATYVQDYQP